MAALKKKTKSPQSSQELTHAIGTIEIVFPKGNPPGKDKIDAINQLCATKFALFHTGNATAEDALTKTEQALRSEFVETKRWLTGISLLSKRHAT